MELQTHEKHIKYPKIHRLGKDETEGIFKEGKLLIEEKIDGANTSIWVSNGELKFGSRNNLVPDFRGLKTYALKHQGILNIFKDFPNYRLFGEWLIKHIISYNNLSYNHFYLYDIYDNDKNEYIDPKIVKDIADKYNIKRPHTFAIINVDGTIDEKDIINEINNNHVGKSILGERGEGVVIKNFGFRNKFGDFSYAKIVTQEFKEDNAVWFGGNNKHSEFYWETYVMNEYINETRVRKIIQKQESIENRKMDIKDTPKIAGIVFHDMIEEECWTFVKKNMKIDFRKLQQLCNKKSIMIFKEILDYNN